MMDGPLAPPPSRVVVLGRPFSLKAGAAKELAEWYGSEVYGYCDMPSRTVAYRNDMDAFDTKDTVLHEVFHAIRHAQGRKPGGAVEEDYVLSLATGLMGVLRDNPEFAAWLLSPTPET